MNLYDAGSLLLGKRQKNPFTSREKALSFFRLKRTRNLDNCNDCPRLDTKKKSSRSFHLGCKKNISKLARVTVFENKVPQPEAAIFLGKRLSVSGTVVFRLLIH
jgi:hypothetical protein